MKLKQTLKNIGSNFVNSHKSNVLNGGFLLNPYIFGGGTVGGWVELGRTTLGSAGDTISVSSLSNKRYYMVLSHLIQTSSNIRSSTRFNSDDTTKYATRDSENGGVDSTATGGTYIKNSGSNAYDGFNVGHISNYSTKEKLMINQYVGYPSAPVRHESVGKWINTSNAISTISQYNDQAGDFATNSEVVVLGYDPADTHTTNFWTELASVQASGSSTTLDSGTFTGKKYLWIQTFLTGMTADVNTRFNSDNTSSYYRRYSVNGGSDANDSGGASTGLSNLVTGGTNTTAFNNMFIINVSTKNKLLISHTIYRNASGAGTSPGSIESVGSWINSTNQITSVQQISQTSNFSSSSIMKIWGSD